MIDDLPPLPEPYTEQVVEYTGIAVNRVDRFPLYTADQMRAYGDARAAAAVARERERCAKACDEHASIEGIAQKCAAAIRASAMPAPEPGAVTGTRHIARSPVSPTDAP